MDAVGYKDIKEGIFKRDELDKIFNDWLYGGDYNG